MDDLTVDERKALLAIARQSIVATLNHRSYTPQSSSAVLETQCGVFVTLKNSKELRGCLGRFDAGGHPLYELVSIMAAESAVHDTRFNSVELDECSSIDIQISVLTPLEKVEEIGEIEIGKHGLQIKGKGSKGYYRSGTLLPQVATEQGWDVNAFLEATCVKAGLSPNDWETPDTEIFKYGAIVFGDLDFGPPPYEIDE